MQTRNVHAYEDEGEWKNITCHFDHAIKEIDPSCPNVATLFDPEWAMYAIELGSPSMDSFVSPNAVLTLERAKLSHILKPIDLCLDGSNINEILQLMDTSFLKTVEFLSGWAPRTASLASCILLHDEKTLSKCHEVIRVFFDSLLLICELVARLVSLTETATNLEFSLDCRQQILWNIKRRRKSLSKNHQSTSESKHINRDSDNNNNNSFWTSINPMLLEHVLLLPFGCYELEGKLPKASHLMQRLRQSLSMILTLPNEKNQRSLLYNRLNLCYRLLAFFQTFESLSYLGGDINQDNNLHSLLLNLIECYDLIIEIRRNNESFNTNNNKNVVVGNPYFNSTLVQASILTTVPRPNVLDCPKTFNDWTITLLEIVQNIFYIIPTSLWAATFCSVLSPNYELYRTLLFQLCTKPTGQACTRRIWSNSGALACAVGYFFHIYIAPFLTFNKNKKEMLTFQHHFNIASSSSSMVSQYEVNQILTDYFWEAYPHTNDNDSNNPRKYLDSYIRASIKYRVSKSILEYVTGSSSEASYYDDDWNIDQNHNNDNSFSNPTAGTHYIFSLISVRRALCSFIHNSSIILQESSEMLRLFLSQIFIEDHKQQQTTSCYSKMSECYDKIHFPLLKYIDMTTSTFEKFVSSRLHKIEVLHRSSGRKIKCSQQALREYFTDELLIPIASCPGKACMSRLAEGILLLDAVTEAQEHVLKTCFVEGELYGALGIPQVMWLNAILFMGRAVIELGVYFTYLDFENYILERPRKCSDQEAISWKSQFCREVELRIQIRIFLSHWFRLFFQIAAFNLRFTYGISMGLPELYSLEAFLWERSLRTYVDCLPLNWTDLAALVAKLPEISKGLKKPGVLACVKSTSIASLDCHKAYCKHRNKVYQNNCSKHSYTMKRYSPPTEPLKKTHNSDPDLTPIDTDLKIFLNKEIDGLEKLMSEPEEWFTVDKSFKHQDVKETVSSPAKRLTEPATDEVLKLNSPNWVCFHSSIIKAIRNTRKALRSLSFKDSLKIEWLGCWNVPALTSANVFD